MSRERPPEKPSFISTQVERGRYLFLDLNPPAEKEFALVCAGREECAPDYAIHRRGFRYRALEYVAGGRWELEMGGQRWELGPGAVFSYGPGVTYSIRLVDPRNPVKFFVDFAGTRVPTWLRAAGLAEPRPRHLHQTRWIHDLLEQLLDCANLSRAAARRLGHRLGELILLRLREDLRFAGDPHPESYHTFERVRQLLQTDYLRFHTIEALAEACHVTPAYLARLFRRYADETPFQYLTRLKMDHAAELLLHRRRTVKEVAAEVGFDDPYHFSRVFKRVHGVSPAHFRRGQ
ncbi:MAG: AraC family transcriptional regulator [Verrucomicrobia bacterium]|nr:MAG: AraC family transcriptional regulator [Verrucomicrobiota bacterium]